MATKKMSSQKQRNHQDHLPTANQQSIFRLHSFFVSTTLEEEGRNK